MMRYLSIPLAILGMFAASTVQAESATQMTIYRSQSSALWQTTSQKPPRQGHALVYQTRQLSPEKPSRQLTIKHLPDLIQPQSVTVTADTATVASQHLVLPSQTDTPLRQRTGEPVVVTNSSGKTLAQGTLANVADNGMLTLVDTDDHVHVIRDYAATYFRQNHPKVGTQAVINLDQPVQGRQTLHIAYQTAGLDWQGAYTGQLTSEDVCKMRFQSRINIANRSQKNWANVQLTLLAGDVHFAEQTAPRALFTMKSTAVNAAPTPQKTSLYHYKTYTLPQPINLPANSITKASLYTPHTVHCQRQWQLGSAQSPGYPSKPRLTKNNQNLHNQPLDSKLSFTAFDSLPAGVFRVMAPAADGNHLLIGEAPIPDTPKGQQITLHLGKAFDLNADRNRTLFKLDQANRTLDEGFRMTIHNRGRHDRTVQVYVHPNRWQQWRLQNASQPPAEKTPDTLKFKVKVSARSEAQIDYRIRYHWDSLKN